MYGYQSEGQARSNRVISALLKIIKIKMKVVIQNIALWALIILVTFLVGYGGWDIASQVYRSCTADVLDINRDGVVNLQDTSVYFVMVQEK